MPPPKPHNPLSPCPCGSSRLLANCCLPYIKGECRAPTAETLMRSRYTAHVLLEIDYLWETWSAEVRVRSSKAEIRSWAESCEWLGLQILATQAGREVDNEGLVTFIALFRQGGQLHQHHEISMFTQSNQGWRYLDHHA